MDIYSNHAYSWNTSKEESFIDGLSKNKTVAETKAALRGYIRSCKNRVVWTGINAKKIEQYAQTKLAEL
tara:strand:+ start:764 stop:970 length:207 start_codon:yes stop_codon:yes gene_type:complete